MEVMFACLADHALADAQGKLSISGIFDRIGCSQFPARQGKMFLVFRTMHEYKDSTKTFPLSIVFRDADRKVLFSIDGEIKAGTVQPGRFGTLNHIVELNDIIFPEGGRYEFAVRAGKSPENVVPFDVDQI
jgi:hypothetical protein